jgi:hypothetical protein
MIDMLDCAVPSFLLAMLATSLAIGQTARFKSDTTETAALDDVFKPYNSRATFNRRAGEHVS